MSRIRRFWAGVFLSLYLRCPNTVSSFAVGNRDLIRPVSRGVSGFGVREFHSSSVSLLAKPKQGSVVDSYRTVSVNCSKCGQRLFRYKKKNGTKSNLIKCYVERIAEDSAGLLAKQESTGQSLDEFNWECPGCQTHFARPSLIHGRPALKIVSGKMSFWSPSRDDPEVYLRQDE